MTTALQIVTSAYKRLNRLSPGEPLGADESAFGFDTLNELVDELGASAPFLYKSILTSAAQTGHITLAAGSWSTIAVGTEIVSVTVDDLAIAQLSMKQYNELQSPTDTGSPVYWAHNGYSTVYLYPVATGQTVKLMTRIGVIDFADQTTDYGMPPGYKAALEASLAVRLAPSTIGKVTAELEKAEIKCMQAIDKYKPAIIDVRAFNGSRHSNIIQGV